MLPTHTLADFASTLLKDAGQAETSPSELLKVFGFLHDGMNVHPHGDCRSFWSVESTENSLFPAPAGGFDLVWDKDDLKPSYALS